MEKYIDEPLLSVDIDTDEGDNEEMYEHFAVTVDKGQSMMRQYSFLLLASLFLLTLPLLPKALSVDGSLLPPALA